MKLQRGFHLTYCSNIHPGETWEEVRANLVRYIPELRTRMGLSEPLGIGLRLSAQAAEVLAQPEELERFARFLQEAEAYVFTINGFPYGVFHGARVKEEVYLPDWKDEERLRYTGQLARILATLLPDEPGLEGSISTVPGAFKTEVKSEDDVRRMALLMLRQVAQLYHLRMETGKLLTLAIEPEPCCHIETTAEAIGFFQKYLCAPEALDALAVDLNISRDAALQAVHEHLGLCYDACHMAIEYEEPAQALRDIAAAGIKICKFQISSALRLTFRPGDGRARQLLTPFSESTYLHQVVERSPAGLVRYTDLPEALERADRAPASGPNRPVEWRVHFHVPIFLEEMKQFQTTQDYLVRLFDQIKHRSPCPYLEVETYTWDVLPTEYKTMNVADAIARELNWVRSQVES